MSLKTLCVVLCGLALLQAAIVGCDKPDSTTLKPLSSPIVTDSEPIDDLVGKWDLKPNKQQKKFAEEFKKKGLPPLVTYLEIKADRSIHMMMSGENKFREIFGTCRLKKDVLTLTATKVQTQEGPQEWTGNELEFKLSSDKKMLSSMEPPVDGEPTPEEPAMTFVRS